MKRLPIGLDSFREIREEGWYYADKSLMVRNFIESDYKVALITRPRRFGKTLAMTMLREFFDITKDSRAIFDGLAIMGTEYATQINSRPVVYLSFKDCKGTTAEPLLFSINEVILKEYEKYSEVIKDDPSGRYHDYLMVIQKLRDRCLDTNYLKISIETLERALDAHYGAKPIVLIDEYDTPLFCSFEYGYHNDTMKIFFSALYGSALKGQEHLHKALLTGIQRVVKESIFSQLNHIAVYTVLDSQYSEYFGLTTDETASLLACYGLDLDEPVKQKYNGYLFGGTEIYNPWSILNYASRKRLESYWINTSTNYLVKSAIDGAGERFRGDFEQLVSEGEANVTADLGCSFTELQNYYTLWGLLINGGYLTVTERLEGLRLRVRIPNGEARSEFLKVVADQANLADPDLGDMFQFLWEKDMDSFITTYRDLVLSCTSFFDAKGNAYHMLFLGMCLSVHGLYKVTSNVEAGYGRSDIRMESLSVGHPHIVIEFKQGEDIETLKEDALKQIFDNEYYAGLEGEVLCVGIAHDKKRCAIAHRMHSLGRDGDAG
jgi:hypothetical protein